MRLCRGLSFLRQGEFLICNMINARPSVPLPLLARAGYIADGEFVGTSPPVSGTPYLTATPRQT